MKFHLHHRHHERGSVLMIALFVAVMFGTFLSSYLYLVRSQQTLVVRARAWNSAIGVAEAGVEEALSQLNPGAPLPAVLDKTANGWGNPSNGKYGPVTRTVADGNYSVYYTGDTCPTIYSTGRVVVASMAIPITRVIQVGTSNVPLFALAMAAKYNLNFNGNNVNTDSFDSGNTNLSTNGRYDATKTSTNGTIASLVGVVNVGNANVNGSVLLGPGATDSIKNNGVVTGGIYNNFNADFPDVILPQTTWVPAIAQGVPMIIDGVLYNYVFGYGLPASGDYSINNLSGNVYVGTNSSIRLLLSGNASPGNIRVAGPGSNSGKLILYMNGPSFTLSGQSTVDGGVASNFTYYGTTNNTSISLSGNASFTGSIYAPEANFTLGGGGSNTYDFSGSSITYSVTMNGHFNFHFDEALLRNGPARAYLAKSWTEL